MNRKLLLSLALVATMMSSASAADALSKNARSLPANAKMENAKVMSTLKEAPQLKTKSAQLSDEVVYSKSLKNGSKIDFVKSADGVVRKQLVRNDNNQRLNLNKRGVSKLKATAPSFYENFSGYDGVAYDWIPANWQDVSKVGHVAPGAGSGKSNLTWAADEPYYDTAIDGDYVAFCQVSIPFEETGEVLEAQDEWLITPSLTVGVDENLYFYLGYKPSWVLLDANTLTFTAQNNILEVHVSDDGGTTWTKQWDCLADAKSYSEDYLWEDAASYGSTWIFVPVSLQAYEGKNIKVAFRYVGINGESVKIDAVSISKPNPQASYSRPTGFFYWGLSPELNYYTKFVLGSAYAESTWLNTSSLDSESFTWNYIDPFTESTPATSNEVNLTLYSPFNMVDGPTLTASAQGAEDSSFTDIKVVQTGSSATYKEENFGACTYDASVGGMTVASLFGSKSDARWTSLLGLTGDDKAAVKSLANLFEKPSHSYALSSVWIQALVVAEPDAEFTLTIKKVSDEGSIGDVIATSKCIMSDAIITNGVTTLPFTFKIKDPITGLEEDGVFTIDSAIYLELTGFKSDKVTDFMLAWVDGVTNPTEVYSYITLDVTQAGATKPKLYATDVIGFEGDNGESIFCTSFMFNTDATFTWFESAENEFAAPNEGGSKTFDIDSYYYSAGWTVVEEDNGTLPEWITYSATDNEEAVMSELTFNVDPLPSGTTGRQFDVTLSIPGTTKVFHITQGTVGVEGVKVSAVKVATVGGNFAVSYPATVNSVKIYNVAGQLVKTATFAEIGSTVIPAQDLAKGMYILKFNDNTTVKAMK